MSLKKNFREPSMIFSGQLYSLLSTFFIWSECECCFKSEVGNNLFRNASFCLFFSGWINELKIRNATLLLCTVTILSWNKISDTSIFPLIWATRPSYTKWFCCRHTVCQMSQYVSQALNAAWPHPAVGHSSTSAPWTAAIGEQHDVCDLETYTVTAYNIT